MKKRWVHLTRDTAAAATATAEESNKGIGQIKEWGNGKAIKEK